MSSTTFEVKNTPPDVRKARAANDSEKQSCCASAVLPLLPFQRPPTLSFGQLRTGHSRTAVLTLRNPTDQPRLVRVTKVPTASGFSVCAAAYSATVNDQEAHELLVPACTECPLRIAFSPAASGNVRGVLCLCVFPDGPRLQAILLGSGSSPPKQKRRGGGGVTSRRACSTRGLTATRRPPLRARNVNTTGPVDIAVAPLPPPLPVVRINDENKDVLTRGDGAADVSLPLNSTHNLASGSDPDLVLHQLCTPPDLSVSVIRSADDTTATTGDCTPRRQTFLIGRQQQQQCVAAASVDSPLRRLTYARAGQTQVPVRRVDAAAADILTTPSELQRGKRLAEWRVSAPQPQAESASAAEQCNVTVTVDQPRMVKLEPFSPPQTTSPCADQHGHDQQLDAVFSTPLLFPQPHKQADVEGGGGAARLSCKPERLSPILSSGDSGCSTPPDVSTRPCELASQLWSQYDVGRTPQLFGHCASPVLSDDHSNNYNNANTNVDDVCGAGNNNQRVQVFERPCDDTQDVTQLARQSARLTVSPRADDTALTAAAVEQIADDVPGDDVADSSRLIQDLCVGVEQAVVAPVSCPSTPPSLAVLSAAAERCRQETVPRGELLFVPLSVDDGVHAERRPVALDSCGSERRKRGMDSLSVQRQRRSVTADGAARARRPPPRPQVRHILSVGTAAATNCISSVTSRPSVRSSPLNRRFAGRRPVRSLKLSRAAAAGVRVSAAVTVSGNPFASRGRLYDRDWAVKRGRGFAAWLNFVLTPGEEFASRAVDSRVNTASLLSDSRTGQSVSHVPRAPSRETLSLRRYAAVSRMNGLRRRALRLYESAAVMPAVIAVERAVERGQLAVRRDRALHADQGLRQTALGWLINYHPLWLRLALETVFAVVIHTRSTDDMPALARFIIDNVLWSADVAAQHRHRTVPHLYGDQFEPAIKRHALKKLIGLVHFLDVAKRARIIEHDPCLFNKHSPIKSSRELLVALSRDLLSGEGCVIKHLAHLGVTVGHVQTQMHEFDYSVANIATDLRCGVRLIRVVELLSGDAAAKSVSLSSGMRAPAVDRHQKLHNVRLAVDAAALNSAALVRPVVDGHQEATLQLIWQLIVKFQIVKNFDLELIDKEITKLHKSLDISCYIHNDKAIEGRRLLSILTPVDEAVRLMTTDEDDDTTDGPSPRVSPAAGAAVTTCLHRVAGRVLLWSRLVAAHYALAVNSVAAAFSDVAVYAALVHHYQPSLLGHQTLQQIMASSTTTTDARGACAVGDGDDEYDAENGELCGELVYPGAHHAASAAQLQARRKQHCINVSRALNAMSELGGVAVLHSAEDFAGGGGGGGFPADWRLVLTQLCLLCGRLLRLGAEQSAARCLQLCWRRRAQRQQLRRQMMTVEPSLSVVTSSI